MTDAVDDLQTSNVGQQSGVEGVILGILVGLSDPTAPWVSYPGSPSPETMRARSIAALRPEDVGRQVALLFEGGDPACPIVVGCIQSPAFQAPPDAAAVNVDLDGERVVLSAAREIVLRCGEASITLTRAGKILLQGTYISSRSTGAHRIKGGSVQIN